MALQGYPTRTHKSGSKIITGTLTLGAAALASTDLITSGVASSVVRTSAGLYTITLADSYSALEYAAVSPLITVAADITAQVVSYTVATKVLVVRTLAAAVETDAATGSVLQLLIVVKEM